MKHAYVFPGQGAQAVGMGKDLYDNVPEAKELFEKANDILGFRITDIMFAGTDDELKQTKVTQPAVFLHSVIMAKALGVNPTLPQDTRWVSSRPWSWPVPSRFEDGLKLVSEACHGHAGRLRGTARHDGRHPRPGRPRSRRNLRISRRHRRSGQLQLPRPARDLGCRGSRRRSLRKSQGRPVRAAPCACP